MVLIRRIYCGVQFKPSILSELIFAGEGMGTFAKDGYTFHRFKVTHVDRSINVLCGRWVGMTPCTSYIQSWNPVLYITYPTMRIRDINDSRHPLTHYSLACTNIIKVPYDINAEDEILIHQQTNPYVQIR